jgi:MarR family 2-MHQ and catechol resistance regulon transcriptional repressor
VTDFTVLEDGLLAETEIHNLATWYSRFSPTKQSLTFEAHLLFLRAYLSLVSMPGPAASMGLSRSRYNVLRILYQAEGKRMRMSDIGEGLNVTPTNITKLIDSLVSDGLARRVTHERDKRMTWAELTEAGCKVFEDLMPRVMEYTERLWQDFSEDEKRVLVHLLAKLRMSLVAQPSEVTISKFAGEARALKDLAG